MINCGLNQPKIIRSHFPGLLLFILDPQLELNSAKMADILLIAAVALIGEVEHVDTLAVQGNQAEAVGYLLVL